MRSWSPLATLSASLAVHGLGLLVVLAAAGSNGSLPALVVELDEEARPHRAQATPLPRAPAAARAAPLRSASSVRARVGDERPAPPAPGETPSDREPARPSTEAAGPPPSVFVDAAPSPLPDISATTTAPAPVISGHAAGGGLHLTSAPKSQPADASASGRRSDGGGGGQGGGGKPGDSVALAVPGADAGDAGSEYGPYLALVRQRLKDSLRYPVAARRRGASGTVHLEILIRADGTVGDVTLLGSSSHQVLDAAALDAARQLPRIPFPRDLAPRPLRARFPIVFELE